MKIPLRHECLLCFLLPVANLASWQQPGFCPFPERWLIHSFRCCCSFEMSGCQSRAMCVCHSKHAVRPPPIKFGTKRIAVARTAHDYCKAPYQVTNAVCAHAVSGMISRARSGQACRVHCCKSDQMASPDISLLSPLLQRQFHPVKNVHLGGTVVKPHCNTKRWWQCDQCPDGHPHEWEARVCDRTRGRACPYCGGNDVCQHNSLAIKDRTVAAQFSNKNPGTARDYTVSSHKVVVWNCQHGHEWKASISSRTSRTSKKGCPDCFDIRNRSQPKKRHPFVTESQHEMKHYWDKNLNDEAGLDPTKIRCRSVKMANWICHQCPKGQPHRWQARIGDVYGGSGCPCCIGRKACICNSLQSLHPEVAAEWDYAKNTGTPSDYSAHSNAKVWWYTSKRGSFRASIGSRTSLEAIRSRPSEVKLP